MPAAMTWALCRFCSSAAGNIGCWISQSWGASCWLPGICADLHCLIPRVLCRPLLILTVSLFDVLSQETGAPVRVLEADDDVANCVQCHPTQAVLATSGIEAVIKVWSPGPNADRTDVARLIKLNQARMKDGPQWYPRGAFQTAMRAHVLQTLTENPDLIPELRSLLVAQGGGGGGRRPAGGDTGAVPMPPMTPASAASEAHRPPGSPASAAVAGTSSDEAREAEEEAGGSSNRDDMDEDDMHHDLDDQNNPYVNCRMS